ncbi:hypothetical protein AB0N05_33165 [Nocardia sp. NPDC051030]|uniref:hypothetical protein n=1 Tax=Nocardia sp. NPDC051030 TaxID=3155162 RepID=UPI003447BD87
MIEDRGHFDGIGLTASGFVPVFGTTSTTQIRRSALAVATAPEPALRSTTASVAWSIALSPLVVMGLLAAAMSVRSEIASGESVGVMIVTAAFFLFFAGPAIIAFAIVALLSRENRRIRRGRPIGYRLWQAAWFCHRCAGCFWVSAPLAGLPAQQLMAPHQFRAMVWRAAGYIGGRPK